MNKYSIDEFVHNYINENYNTYSFVRYIQGHIGNKKLEKNPIYVIENSNGHELYLMYCERESICILDKKSYSFLSSFRNNYLNNYGKHITYYKTSNGYICGTNKLMVHQVIKNLYGQGCRKCEESIDHIDRNPLNNRDDNLRIVDYETQQMNKKGSIPGTKRERKKSAQSLPNIITHDMMPKYVYYCKETRNKNKYNEYDREFFRIEKHPNLEKINKKCISSSKSMTVSIIDKLSEIKEKLIYLDNL